MNVVDAIDVIALSDPNFEDYRAAQIDEVLSNVDDPSTLFDYFVDFDSKYRNVSKSADGKCFPCGRYANALELTMKRLSEINTDESARVLVLILEKGIVSGHAHLTEELIHHIAETKQLAIPHLKRISGNNPSVATAIECIENKKSCN